MCIIVYKDAGIDMPSDTTLRTCFLNNPDGAGYMFRNPDTSITIRKGFMTADALIQSLHSVRDLRDTELVIHFRYATHGDKSPGNTHPFPVTRKIHMLRKVRMTVDYALVHNGVIGGMTHRDTTISDTMCLVKLMTNESEESPYIQKILEYGKFIIMDRAETRMYGIFYRDSQTGIYYSNEGYKPVGYYSAGGKWKLLSEITEQDLIDEYNLDYGTDFKTLEEIDAHADMLDKCDDCIWFEDLTGTCYHTGKFADPRDPDCKFIKWDSETLDDDCRGHSHCHSHCDSRGCVDVPELTQDQLDLLMARYPPTVDTAQ